MQTFDFSRCAAFVTGGSHHMWLENAAIAASQLCSVPNLSKGVASCAPFHLRFIRGITYAIVNCSLDKKKKKTLPVSIFSMCSDLTHGLTPLSLYTQTALLLTFQESQICINCCHGYWNDWQLFALTTRLLVQVISRFSEFSGIEN